MIMLSRLNGQQFALNPDLVERAEATPDTVITLVDGTRLVVRESVPEIIDRIRWLRASILATAAGMDESTLTAGVAEPAGLHHVESTDDDELDERVVPISRGL